MDKLIIAIDFDDTLCVNSSWPLIGEPRLWLIQEAIRWRKEGHKLILWTCREDVYEGEYSPLFPPRNYLTEAVEWCNGFGLEFDAVNKNIYEIDDPTVKTSRKVFANFYIDDKSIVFDDKNHALYGIDLMVYKF